MQREAKRRVAGRIYTGFITGLDCRERLRAALLGAFVADAATMPLHWIYSPEKISAILQGKDPEFYEKPSSPFYQYPVGDLSPYGAEALFVLKSVVEHGGVQVCTSLWLHRLWVLLANAGSVERVNGLKFNSMLLGIQLTVHSLMAWQTRNSALRMNLRMRCAGC
jgi:ADP-ribosylglycohydrolase